MQIEKRLERLEQEYFPESKRRGCYLSELEFIVTFDKKYQGREDSAPMVLRRAHDRLVNRRRQ
jgi:hypothetical protein